MGLNIKNERVHALAREAAQRTGLTQTSVIELALERLLASMPGSEDARRARIERLLTELRTDITGPVGTDDLYDDAGLYR